MIPEIKFLTEQDWLDAAKEELKTETDYRTARRGRTQNCVSVKESACGIHRS